MQKPQVIDLSQEEAESLNQRIKNHDLTESDWKLFEGLIQFVIWLQFNLKEAKISIGRLRRLFGFPRKKKRSPGQPQNKDASPKKEGEADSQKSSLDSSQQNLSGEKEKAKGHGRTPHTSYTGAKTIQLSFPDFKADDPCPLECGGALYEAPSGVIIRVTGAPIATATRYFLEKLRCSLCGETFTASLPEGVSEDEKYDEEAKAVLALQKYYLGSPFKRIESFQAMMGVPLADATQFELVEQVADCLYPIFRLLVILAAQGRVLHNDDTPVKILSLIKENEQDPDRERTGMYTTGIVSLLEKFQIILFFSGRQHAGENLDDVLEHRAEELGKAIQMSDALPASKTKRFETIWCNCLAHAFRKFEEIRDYWPDECQIALKFIGDVYKTDRIAKEVDLNSLERLKLHQCFSSPVMEALKSWLDRQIDEHRVEPNSSLGKAINYMLNHWTELTRFLNVEGAPLDNNINELILKLPIRNRKNAFFYKTEHGALIGDILMSVIYTTSLAGENPLHYLITIQQHRSEVLKSPEKWLPWNYKENLIRAGTPERAFRSSAV